MNWMLRAGGRYLYRRMQEPSTWRGIILSVGGAYAAAHPELIEVWLPVLLAVVGAIGAMFPDVVGSTPSPPAPLPHAGEGSYEARGDGAGRAAAPAADRLRQPVPPQPDAEPAGNNDSWNG